VVEHAGRGFMAVDGPTNLVNMRLLLLPLGMLALRCNDVATFLVDPRLLEIMRIMMVKVCLFVLQRDADR
jgi:hypothetical protein